MGQNARGRFARSAGRLVLSGLTGPLLVLLLAGCTGPWIGFHQEATWLRTADKAELAHARVAVDAIPLSALDSPPVEVRVDLFLENRTHAPLRLLEESLVLLDGRRNRLERLRIESGRGTDGLATLPRATGRYTILFATRDGLDVDRGVLGGFVLEWRVEQNGAVASGRVEMAEDWDRDFEDGD